MQSLWKDFRYAARVLGKSPGFSIVVILSLALAIGANTAIFSMFNAFLLRPLPVDHPGSLIAIYGLAPNAGPNAQNFSYPEWKDFSRENIGLQAIVGSSGLPLSITGGDKPELIWGEIVTGNYFSGLGVHPVIGRGFLPDEDQAPGEKPVCVLSYKLWQRRFHGDPDIAGKTIQIQRHEFTIVGVAPRGFIGTVLFTFVPDVFVPVMMQPAIAPGVGDILNDRANHWMSVRARLEPGVTAKQAEAALNVIARRLGSEYPQTDGELTMHVLPGGARTQPWLYASGLIPATTALTGAAVLLVLLIACANVANLMLARAAARTREMAIRTAVGATRWRIVRQLLAESALLSVAGAIVGIFFAVWFNDASMRFYPALDFDTVDLSDTVRVDPRMFVFAFAISMLATIIFGLFPAIRAARVDQNAALRGEQPGATRFRAGNVLVMVQVALSSILLVGGGLFLRSMQFAQNSDLGFHRTGIAMFSINPGLQGYDVQKAAILERGMLDRLRSISGVDDAAFAYPLPLDAYGGPESVFPEGWQPRSDHEQNLSGHSRVSPHYFNTMGTDILAGRAIDDRDTANSTRVAVINEIMARRYWGSAQNALGRRFSFSKGGTLYQVVGIARNGKYISFGEPAFSFTFTPAVQDPPPMIEVVMRSRRDAASLMPAVREEMNRLDPSLPLFGVRDMPQYLYRTLSIYEWGASWLGTFALIALALAAVGIYGVLHIVVARRTREIGIRMALGARQAQVLRMVLERSLVWVGAGLAAGIALAFAAHNFTGQLIAGVSGADPLTFAAVLLIFLAIVLAASILPARRAARVDPVIALRHD